LAAPVDRGKGRLSGQPFRRLELEAKSVGSRDEAVSTSTETDAVVLKSMAHPGLTNPLTPLDFVHEYVHLIAKVAINFARESRQHRSEKEPPGTGRGVDRKMRIPERHPPCGRYRARMPDL